VPRIEDSAVDGVPGPLVGRERELGRLGELIDNVGVRGAHLWSAVSLGSASRRFWLRRCVLAQGAGDTDSCWSSVAASSKTLRITLPRTV